MPPDQTTPDGAAAHIAPAVHADKIVMVVGGKGGVGTSVISGLLALGCAATGARVLLIDGHEGNATLHHLFGVRPHMSLESLRDPTVSVREVCIELGDAFTLVASRPASTDQLAFSPDARRAPFERLLPMSAEYDCVIVDGGSRLEGILAIANSGASRAIIVTDADRISLAASFALLKALATTSPAMERSILVNRHDTDVAARAGSKLVEACRFFLNATVALADTITEDVCLRAAIGAGMPIGDAAQGSAAAQTMEALALRLFPHLSSPGSAARQATVSHGQTT